MFKPLLTNAFKQTRAFHKNILSMSPQGTVKFFNSEKGFGFVTGDDGKDIFFHITGFKSENVRVVHQGEIVEYEVAEGRQGLMATKIVLISEPQ
jgi:CspA family cold shock protein